ncbi:YbaB/EbfC family nucleoid-associated protein [Umezawaea sp. Da 62-37]|uniref:YbaB/EbfC family nucleoid-associated protein n=1 Tax=Umezawaea sp. Da 62-37 TaxID=3075927 RepID=UPI0028F6CBC6|nr:YbaB/EbfC family nucleoid-associated protein [Umezawaea sp. Da 62-37]WNV90651.1 YbaB/EbfC family nucleoid-associated protein [Umezawaea sp. Da 62-37]
MTTDHRAQVEELLADYRRSRDQLASVQRDLAAITVSVTSEDGTVTATVGSGGALTGLRLADNAYRAHRPDRLAELVLRTTEAAVAKAAERTYRTLAPVLPADTDPAALVRGTADLKPEEIAPPPPAPRRPVADDEDFGLRDSWLDDMGRTR